MRALSRPRSLALVLALAGLAAGCGGKEESQSGKAAAAPPGTSPYAASPYAEIHGAASSGLAQDLVKKAETAVGKGREALLKAQDPSGAFGDPTLKMPPNVGYTAMAVEAVIAATPQREVAKDEHVGKALAYLAKQQKDDGSIYDNDQYVNYMTCASIGAFSMAKVAQYAQNELKARDFVVKSQIGGDEKDMSYGGFPYGEEPDELPDLSNAQFAAQAFHDAELPADAEAWARLRVYLDRVQNRSESNKTEVEAKVDDAKGVVVAGDDGGAYYRPGMSQAGLVKRADGTYEPRSYGSMTYALVKCYLLAGVNAKDPKVQAAIGWIQDHFTLDRNPGFESAKDPEKAGQQGWYYYVFTMARALTAYELVTGKPLEIKDDQGQTHNWRAELVQALLDRQKDDGTWVNPTDRWEESSPTLATSYALVSLAEALGRLH